MADEIIARKRLEKLRKELQHDARNAEGSDAVVELDQSKVGRLSRMDAMQAQAMAEASRDRRGTSLRRIDAALRRLDDGNYGICFTCDEAIHPRRLEFDPAVLLCIGCAAKKEGK